MITFEQFYLTEAKYLDSPQFSHPDGGAYIIAHANGGYHIERGNVVNVGQRPDNLIGYIIKNPDSSQYKTLTNNDNIKAALGVYEIDRINPKTNRPTTQSKIYAYHIAKYKLEQPGARENNNDDVLFYQRTYTETAKLAKEYIRSLNGAPYVILHPSSTMEFNNMVLQRLGANNINTSESHEVRKYTFEQAARNIWTDKNIIEGNVTVGIPGSTDQKLILCKAAISYLSHLINSLIVYSPADYKGGWQHDADYQSLSMGESVVVENRELSLIKLKPEANIAINPETDKVSRERLAYIIYQILKPETNNQPNPLLAGCRRFHNQRNILNAQERAVLNENNAVQKGWFLEYLKPIYFHPLNIKLQPNVLVIDDNIDSAATYNSVNNRIKERALATDIKIRNITWVVGIMPLSRLSRPNLQQAAPTAAPRAANSPQEQAKVDIERLYKNSNANATLTLRNISKFELEKAISDVEKNLTKLAKNYKLEIKRVGNNSFTLKKVNR